MNSLLNAGFPAPSTGDRPSNRDGPSERHGDERALAASTRVVPVLTEAAIAKLQSGAEARARDRARRARLVEAHGRSIEALLRAMHELAKAAASTKFASADRRSLNLDFRALRGSLDALATRASSEGISLCRRRPSSADPAADAMLHAHALGLSDAHLLDVAGAIGAIEATDVALGVVAALRGELMITFRELELQIAAVLAMRANLSAASGRLQDIDARDALADEVVRSMGAPAYKA